MVVLRLFVLLPVVLVSAQLASGQQSKVVTITEPGVYKLANLFKNANVVALVKIVSGDAENYGRTVYKGEVLQSFKGTSQGETVYFWTLRRRETWVRVRSVFPRGDQACFPKNNANRKL